MLHPAKSTLALFGSFPFLVAACQSESHAPQAWSPPRTMNPAHPDMPSATSNVAQQTPTSQRPESWTPPANGELVARKKQLTPEQARVTQQAGTEPPFRNPLWNNHEPGIYVDIVSGEPLFSSKDKFDSGTGWPSFSKALDPQRIEQRRDSTLGMERVELRSRQADSHLGHLFDDGPAPGGMRYCINSASLRFIRADKLEAEGYGAFANLFPDVKQEPPTAR